MLTYNGKDFRNLVEQVRYLTDYHNQDKVLASWGIRIVGQIESASDLPPAETYTGEYGDAYAVGREAPFDFYIFTRSSLEGSGDYWFPFGQISIAGPAGPAGVPGKVGKTGESSKWYVGSNVPQPTALYKPGDMYLQTSTGSVYRFTENQVWLQVTNITGPQGPAGPQGESIIGPVGPTGPQGPRGDVAGLVNIRGQLTSTDQLPSPADLNNLTIAYLVNGDLYIQFGETPQTATWNNVGPLNVGTMVTVNGEYQNVWDADTKAPAHPTSGTTQKVYTSNGTESGASWIPIQVNAYTTTAGTIAIYTQEKMGDIEAGAFLLTKTPTKLYHAANKKYVDNALERYHGRPVVVFTWQGQLATNQKASMTYINTSESLLAYETLDIIITLKSGALISKQIYPQSFTYSDPIGNIYGYDWSFINDGQTISYKIVSANSPSPTFEVTNYSTAEGSKIFRIDVVAYKT